MKEYTKSLNEAMDLNFKFAPGDLVCLKAHMLKWQVEFELNWEDSEDPLLGERVTLNAPPVITVITRLLEECHGNLQGFYTVRLHEGGEPMNPIRVMDHELVAYNEILAVSRQMKEAIKKRRATSEERRRYSWKQPMASDAAKPGSKDRRTGSEADGSVVAVGGNDEPAQPGNWDMRDENNEKKDK